MKKEFPHVKEATIALSSRVTNMEHHELVPNVACIDVGFHMSLVCLF
jgi:hypothetical protein